MSESSSIEYGRLMMQRHRWADAEKHFRQALESDPNSAEILYMLTYSIFLQEKREKEALSLSKSLLELEPDEEHVQELHAKILLTLHRENEALPFLQSALALNPEDPDLLCSLATYHQLRMEWKEVEQIATQVLSLYPEHSQALQLYNTALRLQGKTNDSLEHAGQLLSRDAGNAHHHEMMGWNALQTGDVKQAELHFLESLRIQPNSPYSREGLKEAYRSRNPLYRLYFKHQMWMASFTAKYQWMIIIGLLVLVRVLPPILEDMGLGFLSTTLIYAYLGFIVWTYTCRPIGNILLLFDTKARHALERKEKISSAIITTLALLGVWGMLGGLISGSAPGLLYIMSGGLSLGCAFLMTFAFQSQKPLAFVFISLHCILLLLFAVAILAVTLGLFLPDPEWFGSTYRFSRTSILVGSILYQTKWFQRE